MKLRLLSMLLFISFGITEFVNPTDLAKKNRSHSEAKEATSSASTEAKTAFPSPQKLARLRETDDQLGLIASAVFIRNLLPFLAQQDVANLLRCNKEWLCLAAHHLKELRIPNLSNSPTLSILHDGYQKVLPEMALQSFETEDIDPNAIFAILNQFTIISLAGYRGGAELMAEVLAVLPVNKLHNLRELDLSNSDASIEAAMFIVSCCPNLKKLDL